MINEKQEILATVNTLPDNTTWDDAVYTLYLHSKLQKSKDDIKNGRVMSIEESKEKMRKKYANFHVKWGSWRYRFYFWIYITWDSIKYANETSENIYSRIYELEKTPYLGRYVPELPDKHLRELIYKKYRIVYDISEDSKTVYIHFVVHGSRSFKSFYNSYIKNNF